MKILAIETSCDETAISLLFAEGSAENPSFTVLGNTLLSQIDVHKEYGGVYPNLARREHAKNLTPILLGTLKEAGIYEVETKPLSEAKKTTIERIFAKEPELAKNFFAAVPSLKIPDIDVIAVTSGPGLEPALWVGINFAEALGVLWDLPVLPINHMEGHIYSALLHAKKHIVFPAIALLVSGGHTELVFIEKPGVYTVIGKTRDDAVGEAFDKTARLLDLPYPGGPRLSALAQNHREKGLTPSFELPRPMINTDDFDFSFSGLKTAVLYKLKSFDEITPSIKEEIAHAFEDAAIGVLMKKTRDAIVLYSAKTLIVGGGVSANTLLRIKLEELEAESEDLTLLMPEKQLSTDNALMIGMTAYIRAVITPELLVRNHGAQAEIRANGNLSL